MTAINWKGGNGAWESPAGWTGGTAPVAGTDTALFSAGGTYTVTATNGAAAGLTVSGDAVTFEGQIALYSARILPDGGVSLSGGTLQLVHGANVTIDAATLQTGSLAMDPGTSLDVNGVLLDQEAATSQVRVEGHGALWKTLGGTAGISQLQIAGGGIVAGRLLLQNNGAITLDPTATLGGAGDTLTVVGSGSLLASSPDYVGVTTVSEPIALTSSASVLQVGSNQWTSLVLSGPITGPGALVVNSGMVVLSGSGNNQSGTFVNNATLQIGSAGAAGEGAIWLNNGALQQEVSLDGATVIAQSGTDWISGGGGGMVVHAFAGATLNYSGGSAGSAIVGEKGSASGTLNIVGGSGNDTVFGFNESAVNYFGSDGNAVVYGGTGVLDATGGSGHDTIFAGTSGHDVLQTGTGATTLGGGTAGGTLIAIGPAGNLLAAGGGNTTLNGASATGDNLFFGAHTGNTTIFGGHGHDTIVGTGGADTVFGSHGTENIFAGSGHLQLDFVDGFAGGTTCVQGFDPARDLIRLANYGPNAIPQALASEHVAGGNTILTLPDNTTLIFWNTVGITAHDFVT